jgi:hypothetical protein
MTDKNTLYPNCLRLSVRWIPEEDCELATMNALTEIMNHFYKENGNNEVADRIAQWFVMRYSNRTEDIEAKLYKEDSND